MHFLLAAGFHFVDFFHPLRYWGYQFWSGIGSDIGELAIVGGLITIVRRIQCQTPWCFRFGRHRTADGLHHLCNKHHPDLPNHKLSLEEIQARHYLAKTPQETQPS